MLEELVTDINNFDEKQVDNDVISENRNYFSIYNNKISHPFQKFWFTLSNAKYFTNYNDYSTIRFALNNKSTQIEKFINWIKKLSEYLKKLFSRTFDGVKVELPWKEYDNYPFLLSFFTNNDLVFMDSNKNILTLDKLDNSNSYSILFEIKNLKIIKTELDSEFIYTLKYNMSIIMIQQEPQLDLKSYLLNKLNTKNNINHDSTYNNTINSNINDRSSLPFLSQLSNVSLKSDYIAKNDLLNETKKKLPSGSGPTKLVELDELLKVKSRLIKVNLDSDKSSLNLEDNKSDKHIANLENTFIEQKNQLKKVKTKEKSLLKHLNKTKNKLNKEPNIKSDINKSKNNIENELEEELKNELEKELNREKEFILNTKKSDIKKSKKVHQVIQETKEELEQELESRKNDIKELSEDMLLHKKKKEKKAKTKTKSIEKNDLNELDEELLEKELGLL